VEAALNSPYGRTMLGPGSTTIGRAADNQIVVNDPQASSHHAQVYPDGQGYLLVDVGSTNGTFINEQRLIPNSPRMLNAGDMVRIGNTNFSYEVIGTPQISPTVVANPGYAGPAYEPTIAAPSSAHPDFQQAPQQAYPQPAYPQQAYPQQAYPQQPYAPVPGQVGLPDYAGTAAPPQKRSRLGLWIALIVIVLLIAGGVGGYVYLNRSTPTRTLQTFCSALKSSPPDYQTAYNQYSTRQRARESEQTFASGLQQLFSNPILGGLKDCTVSNVQQNGSNATGNVTLTFNNVNRTLVFNFSLLDESDGWKIDNGTFKVAFAVQQA
jgi:FHA domain-containing protein